MAWLREKVSRPGLDIWRIEGEGEPAKLPKEQHGSFGIAACYICLNWSQVAAEDDWQPVLHVWVGKNGQESDVMAAGMRVAELEDSLGMPTTAFWETQEHESDRFKSNFKEGILYLAGTGGEADRRLLLVKARTHHVLAHEVELSFNSLNSGDVFVLDANDEIFEWHGKETDCFERLQGLQMALRIKSRKSGKCKVIPMEEDTETAAFWTALGGKGEIKAAEEPADEEHPDDMKPCVWTLYSVSEQDGKLVKKQIEAGTECLSRSSLTADETFVVSGGDDIYVWVGEGCSKEILRGSLSLGRRFAKEENKSDWARVMRCCQGKENSTFKDKFGEWSLSGPESDQSSEGHAEAAQVDDGSGEAKVWRIYTSGQFTSLVPVAETNASHFYTGECCVVLYTYMDEQEKEQKIVYTWCGAASKEGERGNVEIKAREMYEKAEGRPMQVRLTEGCETAHFLSIFKGAFVVHKGTRPTGVSSATASSEELDKLANGENEMYRLKSKKRPHAACAVQVEKAASSLSSDGLYALCVQDKVYVWKGKSSAGVDEVCQSTIQILRGFRQAEYVDEESETEAFWEALGGKGTYAQAPATSQATRAPRLFQCVYEGDNPDFHEIFEFVQDDLDHRFVYLLDVGHTVYAWVGAETIEWDRESALEAAEMHNKACSGGRPGLVLARVDGGNEPPEFTKHFVKWEKSKAKCPQDPYQELLQDRRLGSSQVGARADKSAELQQTPAKIEDGSPFPVKLRSVTARGERVDTSHDTATSSFPAVKLKAITRPGDKEHEEVQASPFGTVRLKSVAREEPPAASTTAAPNDQVEGVQVDTLFGARLLREDASTATTPFGARLKQKAFSHVQVKESDLSATGESAESLTPFGLRLKTRMPNMRPTEGDADGSKEHVSESPFPVKLKSIAQIKRGSSSDAPEHEADDLTSPFHVHLKHASPQSKGTPQSEPSPTGEGAETFGAKLHPHHKSTPGRRLWSEHHYIKGDGTISAPSSASETSISQGVSESKSEDKASSELKAKASPDHKPMMTPEHKSKPPALSSPETHDDSDLKSGATATPEHKATAPSQVNVSPSEKAKPEPEPKTSEAAPKSTPKAAAGTSAPVDPKTPDSRSASVDPKTPDPHNASVDPKTPDGRSSAREQEHQVESAGAAQLKSQQDVEAEEESDRFEDEPDRRAYKEQRKKWEVQFAKKYCAILGLTPEELFTLDPTELMIRMEEKQLFQDGPEPPVSPDQLPLGIGINPKLPYHVDVSPIEKAVRLLFSPERGEWRKKPVDIKVAEAMYAKGIKMACICFKDLPEDKVMVLKKRLDISESPEDVFSGVEMQTLGVMACNLLAASSPPSCRPKFLPCAAYVLKNRPHEPTVRVEELVPGPYDKRALSLDSIGTSSTPAPVADQHRFAAFQYFTYKKFNGGILFHSAVEVSGFWSEPMVLYDPSHGEVDSKEKPSIRMQESVPAPAQEKHAKPEDKPAAAKSTAEKTTADKATAERSAADKSAAPTLVKTDKPEAGALAAKDLDANGTRSPGGQDDPSSPQHVNESSPPKPLSGDSKGIKRSSSHKGRHSSSFHKESDDGGSLEASVSPSGSKSGIDANSENKTEDDEDDMRFDEMDHLDALYHTPGKEAEGHNRTQSEPGTPTPDRKGSATPTADRKGASTVSRTHSDSSPADDAKTKTPSMPKPSPSPSPTAQRLPVPSPSTTPSAASSMFDKNRAPSSASKANPSVDKDAAARAAALQEHNQSLYDDPATVKFSYEELVAPRSEAIQKRIDPARIPLYLSDEEMQLMMGCSRTEYLEMQEWKQKQLRKKTGLF